MDTTICRARGIDPIDLARAALAGGARLVQIRAKEEPTADAIAVVEGVLRAAGSVRAKVIVNDRADIARITGADGVHVGQTDLPVDAVRAIVGPSAIVGLSTHDRAQIDRALASAATYIAVGPIFSTDTKDTGYGPRGLELVAYAANRGKPVVAIGGITLERAPDVCAAGASAVAVITDILTGGDPEARVRAFVQRLPVQPFNV
ncbi:MAG TPA: thiamine phosphate synthase [Vicinamibacterales bacterium]